MSTTTATCGKAVCTWDAFGPKTYTRPAQQGRQDRDDDRDDDDGAPVFTDTFSVQNIATTYTLQVVGEEHARAEIFLNGKRVIDEDDFHGRREDGDGDRDDCSRRGHREEKNCELQAEPVTVDKAVVLQSANTLKVRVRGRPGSSIVVSVIGVDNDAPVISATVNPAPNTFGWNNTSVLVTFVCSDATSGIATCPTPINVNTDGANQIVSGTAIDRVGNSASMSVTANLDRTAPTVVPQVAPPPNTANWNNTSVTVSFNCADALSGVASCSAPVSLTNEGASQTVTGTAVDKAGNSASTTAIVNIDKTPPVISITTPLNNALVSSALLQVTGTVTDALSGVASVSCNGLAATIQSGAFGCSVALAAGVNTINVLAADIAGNTASQSISVNFGFPIIADFSPKSAAIGSLITVNGSNLTTGGGTIVILNRRGGSTIAAPVANASPTSISFVIPAGAVSGPVTITVGGASAISAETLNILPRSNFALNVGPQTASVIQGNSTVYAISLNSGDGFSQLASLSVSGLPSGVSAVFSPTLITSGQIATLTVNAPAGQPLSNSTLSVSASASVDGLLVTQSANVVLAVQPGTTTLLGRIVESDTVESPLGGITINLLGVDDAGHTTGCTGQVVSDAGGNFAFSNLPAACVGRQLVAYNGNTATDGEKYASVNLAYTLVAGQVTGPELVHLPRIDNGETILVKQNAPADQVFSYSTMPGVTVTVYAGTIFTEPDGSQPDPFPMTGVLVPVDRLPDTPIDAPGTLRATIVAFQPADTISNQPVSVTFPNSVNTPPGVKLELDTLDPVVGMLVRYGTGTVSGDGAAVIPDPDPAHPGHRFGIQHFDWHGPIDTDTGQVNPSSDPNQPKTGDPVDPASGLLLITNTDAAFGGTLGPVELTRTYRTLSNTPGPFGIGTSHNYGYLLDVSSFERFRAPIINLQIPEGNRFAFAEQPNGTFLNSTDPSYQGDILTPSIDLSSYRLLLKNGTAYLFRTFPDAPLIAYLSSITDSNGNTITLTHGTPDHSVQITQITDPVGRSLNLAYDSFDRVTAITDPIGRIVRYTYDSQGNLSTFTDAAGGVTRYVYDSNSRPTSITDARGVTFLQNTYDQNGKVSRQTDANGATTTFAYTLLNPNSAVGSSTNTSPVILTTVTDPRGNQTTYHFSPQSFLLDTTDALGEKTVYTLNPGNNLLLSVTDPLNRTTAYTYDSVGNMASTTYLAGTAKAVTTSFTHDPVFNKLTSITDELGNKTSMTYDAHGNLLTVVDPLGNQTEFTYDAAGELLTTTDPLGDTTRFAYQNGSLASITDPLGNTKTQVVDPVGRILSSTTPMGKSTSYSFDPLNRTTQIIDARGGSITLSYDPNGNLLSLEDALGHTTTYTYDLMDRISTRTDPLSRQERYQYDLAGNMSQRTDRRGRTTTYQYDALNRRISASFGVNGNSSESTITYDYDAGGRMVGLVDSDSGRITRNFDDFDRMVAEVTPQGAVSYAYDTVGRRTSMTVAGQPPISYAFDRASHLTQVSQDSSSVSLSYDHADRRSSLTLPNGVTVTYSYDTASHLTAMVYSFGGKTLGSLTYSYDQLGRRTQVGGSFARTNLPAAVTAATYDAANELLNWNGIPVSNDDNGNILADGTNTFVWNARNQLASINGATAQYDAAGRRIKNPQGVSFLYDDSTPVQELSGSTPVANRLTGGVDEFFSRSDSSGTEVPLADALGSVLALTDDSGNVNTQYTFEPFGSTTAAGASSSNPFQYTGRENDGGGIYYYRARYYSPIFGRFLSEDSAPNGGNLYPYVDDDPLNYTDAFGLKPQPPAPPPPPPAPPKKKLRKGDPFPYDLQECMIGPAWTTTSKELKASNATDKELLMTAGEDLSEMFFVTSVEKFLEGPITLETGAKVIGRVVRKASPWIKVFELGRMGVHLTKVSLKGQREQDALQEELMKARQSCIDDLNYEIVDE